MYEDARPAALCKLMDTFPRRVRLHPEDWAQAWQVGRLRKASNDGKRRECDERGGRVDLTIDVVGAMSEILVARELERAGSPEGAAYIRGRMICSDGPTARGPDCLLGSAMIECKTAHMRDQSCRNFFINQERHQRYRGPNLYYVGAAVRSRSSVAVLYRPIPSADVDRLFETFYFGCRPGYTPALGIDFSQFARRYASQADLDAVREAPQYDREGEVIPLGEWAAQVVQSWGGNAG